MINCLVPDESIISLTANKFSLYGGGQSGSIYQWNVSSGIQTTFINAHLDQVWSLELNNDLFYSGSLDSTAKAWDTTSLGSVRVFLGKFVLSPYCF